MAKAPAALKGLSKSTLEVMLPADNSLTSANFTIDPAGNVVVKNKDLADALKRGINKGSDPNIAAVKVGVVVDV
jgi:hypothetical protein